VTNPCRFHYFYIAKTSFLIRFWAEKVDNHVLFLRPGFQPGRFSTRFLTLTGAATNRQQVSDFFCSKPNRNGLWLNWRSSGRKPGLWLLCSNLVLSKIEFRFNHPANPPYLTGPAHLLPAHASIHGILYNSRPIYYYICYYRYQDLSLTGVSTLAKWPLSPASCRVLWGSSVTGLRVILGRRKLLQANNFLVSPAVSII